LRVHGEVLLGEAGGEEDGEEECKEFAGKGHVWPVENALVNGWGYFTD
jgi:hypothetical protein